MEFILCDLKDDIGTIQFNNDAKRNSLNRQMLEELMTAFARLEKSNAHAVILRAAPGAKVWSAGLDVCELPEPGRDPLSYNDPLEQVLRIVQKFPAPVIAMVEGGVWGGACDLVFVCDMLVGAPSATFAITPAKIGVPYNSSGILHFLNVLGAHYVKEMFFTAEPLSAQRAANVGILNHLVPAQEIESFTRALVCKIRQNSPLAIRVIKEQLRILTGSHPISPETFERIQGLRRLVYDSEDYKEGVRAFKEKRKPVFKGA